MNSLLNYKFIDSLKIFMFHITLKMTLQYIVTFAYGMSFRRLLYDFNQTKTVIFHLI